MLERELTRSSDEYRAAAETLSRSRKAAAEKLAKKVEVELGSLALETQYFASWCSPPIGRSRVRTALNFLSPQCRRGAAHAGQSGFGRRASRIALALKTSAALPDEANSVQRTLVFDEVDSGIGGSVAEAVGGGSRNSRLRISALHHAPGAGGGFADHHYFVRSAK